MSEKKRPGLPLRILIVEDNAVDMEQSKAVAQRLGFEVKAVKDGQKALAQIEREKFDLVILDWNLPEVTGWEFLKRLRGDYAPTIVVYSGTALQSNLFAKSPRYQVIDVWQKPLTPLQLTERLTKIQASLGE